MLPSAPVPLRRARSLEITNRGEVVSHVLDSEWARDVEEVPFSSLPPTMQASATRSILWDGLSVYHSLTLKPLGAGMIDPPLAPHVWALDVKLLHGVCD